MSDLPARDDSPDPAPAVRCPKCGARLRLVRPATVHTPIACCECETNFYLQPVETAALSESVGPPRRPAGYPLAGQGARPAREDPAPAFRIVSPPPTRPADQTQRQPAGPPTALTTPAPPVPAPGLYAAPGMPRPVQLPDHLQRNFASRWLESVLGASLVLLLVTAACAGGFVLWRAVWAAPAGRDPSESAAASPNASPDAPPLAATPTSILGVAEPLPRPDRLAATWESRADDGSHSLFVFRPDGTVTIKPAGDPPPPPVEASWFLAEQRADYLVVEIGQMFGNAGNYRFTLRFTGPDAFTLTRTIRLGVTQINELRYVRVAPAPEIPPPLGTPPPP